MTQSNSVNNPYVNSVAPVIEINADPPTLNYGQNATIYYGVFYSNAYGLPICVASGNWSGSKPSIYDYTNPQIVTPPQGGCTYTLSCTNSGGTGSATTLVTVYGGPPLIPGTCVGNVGTACSVDNSCGQTNPGYIQCDGTCGFASPYPVSDNGTYWAFPAGHPGSNDSYPGPGLEFLPDTCDGASTPFQCPAWANSTCVDKWNAAAWSRSVTCRSTFSEVSSPPNPIGYGQACVSTANSCGMTNNGIIGCGGCSANTPTELLCITPVVVLSTDKDLIVPNEKITLTWEIIGLPPASCTISATPVIAQWSGTLSGGQVAPGVHSFNNIPVGQSSSQTTYTIDCGGPTGQDTVVVTLKWTRGDGKCETTKGENVVNSPKRYIGDSSGDCPIPGYQEN